MGKSTINDPFPEFQRPFSKKAWQKWHENQWHPRKSWYKCVWTWWINYRQQAIVQGGTWWFIGTRVHKFRLPRLYKHRWYHLMMRDRRKTYGINNKLQWQIRWRIGWNKGSTHTQVVAWKARGWLCQCLEVGISNKKSNIDCKIGNPLSLQLQCPKNLGCVKDYL